jgi:hypothetical protein
MIAKLTHLGLIWFARPKHLGLTTTSGQFVWVKKNLKFFKSMIGLQKQTLSHSSRIFHSYAVELNCKLFFLWNLFYKFVIFEKERIIKKILSSKWFISSIQKWTFFFLYALWMQILILCFHPNVEHFFKGFMLF